MPVVANKNFLTQICNGEKHLFRRTRLNTNVRSDGLGQEKRQRQRFVQPARAMFSVQSNVLLLQMCFSLFLSFLLRRASRAPHYSLLVLLAFFSVVVVVVIVLLLFCPPPSLQKRGKKSRGNFLHDGAQTRSAIQRGNVPRLSSHNEVRAGCICHGDGCVMRVAESFLQHHTPTFPTLLMPVHFFVSFFCFTAWSDARLLFFFHTFFNLPPFPCCCNGCNYPVKD